MRFLKMFLYCKNVLILIYCMKQDNFIKKNSSYIQPSYRWPCEEKCMEFAACHECSNIQLFFLQKKRSRTEVTLQAKDKDKKIQKEEEVLINVGLMDVDFNGSLVFGKILPIKLSTDMNYHEVLERLLKVGYSRICTCKKIPVFCLLPSPSSTNFFLNQADLKRN